MPYLADPWQFRYGTDERVLVSIQVLMRLYRSTIYTIHSGLTDAGRLSREALKRASNLTT